MKISKNRYLQGFGIVVLLLALVRVIFPGVAKPKVAAAGAADSTLVAAKDSAASDASSAEISDASADTEGNVAEDLKEDELSVMPDTAQSGKPSIFFDKDGKEVKHRIFSVPHFGNTFPDQQDVQILATTKHGVKPVQNRLEAENSKGKLVYVGSNPFFYVDKLNNSIPYAVPLRLISRALPQAFTQMSGYATSASSSTANTSVLTSVPNISLSILNQFLQTANAGDHPIS